MALKGIIKRLALCLLLSGMCFPISAQKSKDSEELGKALDYFTSAKYHEALLIFQRLEKEYNLNPRFKAYLGLCYYHEWDYKTAARHLEAAIPYLDAFAPHERSVYYFTTAESLFNMRQYRQAIPYYEKTLAVCYDREKGDVYYRMGLCYMFLQVWRPAYDLYMSAEKAYQQYGAREEVQARLAQTRRMAVACRANYEAEQPLDPLSKESDNTTENDNVTTQLKSISTILKSLTSTMLLQSLQPIAIKDIIKEEERKIIRK